jgi:hypothetical protein
VKLLKVTYRGIVLPVAALLKQYKENPDVSMIRHFDLMFIQQSIGKLTSSVRILALDHYEYILTMLAGTNGFTANFAPWPC